MNRVETEKRQAALDSLWGDEERARILAAQITQMQNLTIKIREFEYSVDNSVTKNYNASDMLRWNSTQNYLRRCKEMEMQPMFNLGE